MNALLDHIFVQLMPYVETQLDPTTAHAEQAILETEELVVTLMNVMDHINVQLMPLVPTLWALYLLLQYWFFWKW